MHQSGRGGRGYPATSAEWLGAHTEEVPSFPSTCNQNRLPRDLPHPVEWCKGMSDGQGYMHSAASNGVNGV